MKSSSNASNKDHANVGGSNGSIYAKPKNSTKSAVSCAARSVWCQALIGRAITQSSTFCGLCKCWIPKRHIHERCDGVAARKTIEVKDELEDVDDDEEKVGTMEEDKGCVLLDVKR